MQTMINSELIIDGKKQGKGNDFPEVVDLHTMTDGITTTISRTISGFSVAVREIHFQGFSFVNQRYKADADVELHVKCTLANPVMAMGYVRSGSVWNEYELQGSDVALTVQPHEDDTRLKFRKGTRVDVFNILLLPEYVRSVCERNPDVLERFMTSMGRDIPMEAPAFQGGKRLLRSLNGVGDYYMMGKYVEKFLESKVLECLTEYFYQKEDVEERPLKYNFLLRDNVHDARQVMLRNYQEPPSLHELAAMVGTNECTLKKAFKEEYGITVFQCLFDYRMELAAKYLLDSQRPIADIATRLGYDYQSHFCTAFRRKYGISPTAFRSGVHTKA